MAGQSAVTLSKALVVRVCGVDMDNVLAAGAARVMEGAKKKRQRHLQSPCDCPACNAKHKQLEYTKEREIPAWSAQHSGRGRPKQVRTDGHNCHNPAYLYYPATEISVYAMVGYTKIGMLPPAIG